MRKKAQTKTATRGNTWMKSILSLFIMALLPMEVLAQWEELTKWEFSRDRQTWIPVTVPHDWAISGPFDKKWDLQKVAIEQNGEKEATEKSGRSGALPWIGKGYYRTKINVDGYVGHAELVFDGAMAEPVVRINGKVAGGWKYGYNAFRVDITSLLHDKSIVAAQKAFVEVELQNLEESSRWYPGAGLYRPVRYVVEQKSHIDDWSIFVRTLSASAEKAVVRISGKVIDPHPGQMVSIKLRNGDVNLQAHEVTVLDNGDFTIDITVDNPELWSPESPHLYQLHATLYETVVRKGQGAVTNKPVADMSKLLDSQFVRFGIRTVGVSKERGFELNGVPRKIQGVCLHHDLGPLGAAVNKAALARQIRILKDMGCDAIRTAHNMPSTWQMEVCDEMGMMVMAESFDMWIYPKCKNGYARFFKEWADKDITNLVLNHRNHPSIVMWSIGNEIPEQWDANEGVYWSEHLQNLIHQLDPTRPVTQGMDRADDALKSGFAQVMDVPGFNYRVHKYDRNITQLPKGFLLGSETASTVSSRGVYKFPVVVTNQGVYPDGQCSSYDTEYCSWSNLPDDDFLMMDDRDWTIGQFVWTGFDYLGEPTPYDEYWPSRSSYFGICDLAGLPKDRYYLYRSQWNKKEHTLHILPHWTWHGREGQVTPVYVYTDFPEAELFVNGKSQGRRKKNLSANQIICNPDSKGRNEELLDRYRLRWNDVVYEPGEIRVVAYDENGKAVGGATQRTAGFASQLRLDSDKLRLNANGQDLAFVTVSLTDENGTLLPDASDQLTFSVDGAGTFRAVCNGDATSLEPFTKPQMCLFHGQLVVVVQAGAKAGTLTLKVRDDARGLEQSLKLQVK